MQRTKLEKAGVWGRARTGIADQNPGSEDSWSERSSTKGLLKECREGCCLIWVMHTETVMFRAKRWRSSEKITFYVSIYCNCSALGYIHETRLRTCILVFDVYMQFIWSADSAAFMGIGVQWNKILALRGFFAIYNFF